MSSKASFNKNYWEKEYKTLSKRIWDAIDVWRDYEKIITPSEFFLAGFIWANTDLRVAGRLFSLMIKNANTQERKVLSHDSIMKRQVPLSNELWLPDTNLLF